MLVRHAIDAMGTRFEVVLHGDDPRHLRVCAEAALAEVAECEERLSVFRRDSLLAHVNTHAAAGPVRVDDDTFELLAACAHVHRQSGGAFDVTVAPLMHAWGFRGESRGDVVAARAVTGMDRVELDAAARTVRFRTAGVRLDLGGVAKGHALDVAWGLLRDEGVGCALLHGGTSTTVAIGAPPGTDGWRVALAASADAPVVTLRDAALSVSAPHGRTVATADGAVGHVLDPRCGRPLAASEGRTRIAAVVSTRARDADAWSTALLVLGDMPPARPPGLTAAIKRGDDADAWTVAGDTPGLFAVPVLVPG